MSSHSSLRQLLLAALVLFAVACGSAPAPVAVGPQLRFGAQMAERGLWNEALFRFRQAQRLEPANSRVLNNVAVALEAVGKFEEAQTTYQRAAEIDPRNTEVKKNLARFVEFYQGYKIKPVTATTPATTASPTPTSAATGTEAPKPPPPGRSAPEAVR